MPYVAPKDALNQIAVDLHSLIPPFDQATGGLPGRRPLVATDKMRWILLHWPPGFVTVPHYHPRAEEAFFILKGEAIFRFGSEATQRRVGPGTLLYANVGDLHTIGVPGPDPLLFVVALSPNEDAADETVEVPTGVGVTL